MAVAIAAYDARAFADARAMHVTPRARPARGGGHPGSATGKHPGTSGQRVTHEEDSTGLRQAYKQQLYARNCMLLLVFNFPIFSFVNQIIQQILSLVRSTCSLDYA